jgi:hypothetical protein
MGDVIIRIQAKPQVVDGITFYNTAYAYKPYNHLGASKINAEFHRRTCLHACRAWAARPDAEKKHILVNYHGYLYVLKYCTGTVYDFAFDRKPCGQVVAPVRKRRVIMFHPRTDPSMGDAA